MKTPRLLRLLPLLGLLASSGLLADDAPSPARRYYFANDDHTDYMWTGTEETYRRVLAEMFDYYLDLADTTAGNPAAHQSRWFADGSFWVWNYEHNRTGAEFTRLIERIRDGHVGVTTNALVSCYGGQPTEAVLRGMYYAGDLERRFNLRIPIAIAMENQTLPYGLGALWAGSGVEYSWKGICGCATKFDKKRPRPYEIYWWKNDDGSRILMKWNTLIRSVGDLGGYAEAQNPERSLKYIETSSEFKARWPYSIMGVFGKGEDRLKTLTDEFVPFAQTNTTADRQITVSNEVDFFKDFEKTYGKDLPEFNASFGNEWDLYAATMSEVCSQVRRSVERLRGAESLSLLVARQEPGFLERRVKARNLAWMNLGIFWEHDWTADGPIITRQARADWQRRTADQIGAYVNDLERESAETLGGLIANPQKKNRFFVFNSLSWSRSDVADLPYEGPAEVHVVDVGTGAEVPSQVVTVPDREHVSGIRKLRIWAADLPSVGYKVFEIQPGKGKEFPAAATYADGVFESERYRLKLADNGTIVSFVDKQSGNRDFARPAGLNNLGAGTGALAVENAGPVSVTVKAIAAAPIAHATRITLYRDGARIDIDNEITQNFGDIQQWNFVFNLEEPDVRHEELGAILHAKLTTDGGNYSPVNSRLEWLTLNHFVSMSGKGGAGISLSNRDCAFFRLGHSTTENRQAVFDTKTPAIHVLAGGMIDQGLGIYNQGGDSYFLQRFALRPYAAFDAAAEMKFSLEHQNPPVTGGVRDGQAYPADTYSLFSVSDPNVLLWALKPAEEGLKSGVIARVWNLSDQPQTARLTLTGGIASAKRTTHIETDLAPATVTAGAVEAKLEKTQLQTFRLISNR